MTDLQTLQLIVTSILVPMIGAMIWLLKKLVETGITFLDRLMDHNAETADRLDAIEERLSSIEVEVKHHP